MTNFNNINSTPVNTYRWLRVNTTSLKEVNLDDINTTVNKEILNEGGIKINSLEKVAITQNLKSSSPVGAEVRDFVNNNYNDSLNIEITDTHTEPVVIRYSLNKDNKAAIDVSKILFKKDSKATLIFVYEGEGYHIGRKEVISEAGSKGKIININLLKGEALEINELIGDVNAYGSLELVNINLGENKIYDNVNLNLGEKARGELYSLYLGTNKDEIDINYVANHIGRESESIIQVRGALLHNSTKTFRGTIDFKRGASKSKGREEEYVMLLSPKVKNKAMPLLLCDEDDVSGEHAAACGRIDEDALFYLMSRGLSEEESKKLIIQGNFNPILDRVEDQLLIETINNTLKGRLLNE